MMRRQGSVAFIIPCFNEEITVRSVVESCRRAIPHAQIFVFDNNSTDKTASLARSVGAEVVHSPRPGKGNVIQHAFNVVDADAVVILDGDNTYPAEVSIAMTHAIFFENYDMVVCNRKAVAAGAAYPRFHKLGNKVFSKFVTFLLGQPVGDVFSGYRAFSREFYKGLVLESEGFQIESELTLKATSHGFAVKEVEGPYISRPPGSHSKLNTFRDGFSILKFIFMIMRDARPLPFFGFSSLFCFGLSIWAGSAPIAEYLAEHYVHTVPRAILAGSLMVLSIVLFGVGVILDSQVRNFRQLAKLTRRTLLAQESSSSPQRRAG